MKEASPNPPSRTSQMDSCEKKLQRRGYRLIAGIDEAGRGPLAGPVVAGCVLWEAALNGLGIADSKSLSPAKREWIFEKMVKRGVTFATGLVGNASIDATNILKATLKAMALAVAGLPRSPDTLLIDGNFPIPMEIPQQTLIRGDQRSISIAAASIVAKVTRDRLMLQYHQLYPQYNFARNKGYPTREHLKAIDRYGCCPLHRLSFRGLANLGIRNEEKKYHPGQGGGGAGSQAPEEEGI